MKILQMSFFIKIINKIGFSDLMNEEEAVWVCLCVCWGEGDYYMYRLIHNKIEGYTDIK